MSDYNKAALAVVLLLLLSVFPAWAYNVKGTVCDSIGEPEEFATVRLYHLTDTVRPLAAVLTDEQGAFDLVVASAGSYRLYVSSLGKQPYTDEIRVTSQSPETNLGKIVLSSHTGLLDAVTVTAQRPLVTKEIDRIGYDVQADADASTSRLDEMLKKVPLVSVDPDGTIKVKGSTDFKIYKNGRPNNSFSRNAKELFKALPASMIRRIEVIIDPGAREDAEGSSAILNIVTMENSVVRGVMGSVGMDYTTSDNFPTPSLWISSQIDRLSLSAYGGYDNYTRRSRRTRTESFIRYEDSGNELSTVSDGYSSGNLGYFGLEGSMEIDSLHLITAEFGGYAYGLDSYSRSNTSMKNADGSLIYSYAVDAMGHPASNTYLDFNGGINYQQSTRRKGESVTLSYLVSSTRQSQESMSVYEDGVNMPVPYTGTSNDFSLRFMEHTGQLDWTRPLSEQNKFDVGLKYIHRGNHSVNDQEYYGWKTSHTDFKHVTQVFAVYADYRLKWRKFGARAGVRYEFSHLSARFIDGSAEPFASSLSDWVPNAAISYDFNDGNTLRLTYGTHISRPGISQLNPAVVSTPTSISSGNPDLSSARHNSLNLNFNHIGSKLSFDLSTSYSFINNAIIAVQELLDGDVVKSGYANSGKNRWWNIAAWANFTPTGKTSIMVNANLNYGYSSNPSLGISASGWGGFAYMRFRQQLPWKLSLSAYANLYQSTPGIYSSQDFSWSGNFYYGLGLQRSFLSENRLNVALRINRPFGKSTGVYTSRPCNNGQTGFHRTFDYSSANIVGVELSYRFGSLNVQVKKAAASISNDDVENRHN